MRIGIVGTENSHADHYIRHFNTEADYPGHRVVALSGGPNDRNRQLAKAGDIADIVQEPAELIGLVDAAIVCSRDGRKHRAEATVLLDASMPVLVDKPLACDLEDAQAILDTAARRGVPVTSFSALRYARQVTDIKLADPDLLAITGPADATSPYGGIFFYGIHIAEIALALAPGRPIGEVSVQNLDDAVIATTRAGKTTIMLEFVKPDTRTEVPWRIVAASNGRLLAEQIRLDADYARPSIDVFAAMLDSGTAPLSDAELLAPVRILSALVPAIH